MPPASCRCWHLAPAECTRAPKRLHRGELPAGISVLGSAEMRPPEAGWAKLLGSVDSKIGARSTGATINNSTQKLPAEGQMNGTGEGSSDVMFQT